MPDFSLLLLFPSFLAISEPLKDPVRVWSRKNRPMALVALVLCPLYCVLPSC